MVWLLVYKKEKDGMKNSRGASSTHRKQPASHKVRPENKDNLDSRENKENGYLGRTNEKGDREIEK